MGKTPQADFVIWLILTVMLGILWILVQYGRRLWMRTKTIYIRLLWMQEAGFLSNNDVKSGKIDGEDTSQDRKDKAKS